MQRTQNTWLRVIFTCKYMNLNGLPITILIISSLSVIRKIVWSDPGLLHWGSSLGVERDRVCHREIDCFYGDDGISRVDRRNEERKVCEVCKAVLLRQRSLRTIRRTVSVTTPKMMKEVMTLVFSRVVSEDGTRPMAVRAPSCERAPRAMPKLAPSFAVAWG